MLSPYSCQGGDSFSDAEDPPDFLWHDPTHLVTRNHQSADTPAESGSAKRRVAGYARVSTDSDEQFTSYEAQVDHYTKFIQSKPE